LLIIGRHTPHHCVIAAGGAIIIDAAVFSSNHTGLHPDAGISILLGLFFKLV
jgi:hypothetical protein